METGEFLRRQPVEAGAGLFAEGFRRQGPGDRRLARKFRVSADQGQAFVRARRLEYGERGLVKGLQIGEGAGVEGALDHPGRQLEGETQGRGERGLIHLVEGRNVELRAGEAHAPAPAQGWVASQWRAMSTRLATQTRSWAKTCSMKRLSARIRPGRPTTRQCKPTDIILGAVSPSA